MASQLDRQYTSRSRVNPMTTLLASGWGLISAYILFTTLLSPLTLLVKLVTVLAALFPLIAVWATIERKRWGRLALIGLSTTAVGFFVATAGYYAAVTNSDALFAGRLPVGLQQLPFDDSPFTLGALLVLAVANGLWLRSPRVIIEFEYNKRPTLAIAQRVIAASLVGCWSVIIVALIYLPRNKIGTTSPEPGVAYRSHVTHSPRFGHGWRRHHATPSF
jgi:hypothetical protein